jgi:hypothetical protein
MRSHGGDRRRETVELFGVENDDGSLAAHRHGLRSLGMGAAHELAEARFCILELPAWRSIVWPRGGRRRRPGGELGHEMRLTG